MFSLFPQLKTKDYKLQTKSGLTLVELIVVIGIFGIISSIVLVNNNRFNSSILVTNMAYEIALTIRQAQVFGLSVREFAIGSNEFNIGYGVHFDTSSIGTNSFIFFGDRNRDNIYNDSDEELVEIFSLRQGILLKKFCVIDGSGVRKCSDLGEIDKMDITFTRPLPEVAIKTDIGSVYSTAEIYVSSPQGKEKIVKTEITGQIYVQ